MKRFKVILLVMILVIVASNVYAFAWPFRHSWDTELVIGLSDLKTLPTGKLVYTFNKFALEDWVKQGKVCAVYGHMWVTDEENLDYIYNTKLNATETYWVSLITDKRWCLLCDERQVKKTPKPTWVKE